MRTRTAALAGLTAVALLGGCSGSGTPTPTTIDSVAGTTDDGSAATSGDDTTSDTVAPLDTTPTTVIRDEMDDIMDSMPTLPTVPPDTTPAVEFPVETTPPTLEGADLFNARLEHVVLTAVLEPVADLGTADDSSISVHARIPGTGTDVIVRAGPDVGHVEVVGDVLVDDGTSLVAGHTSHAVALFNTTGGYLTAELTGPAALESVMWVYGTFLSAPGI